MGRLSLQLTSLLEWSGHPFNMHIVASLGHPALWSSFLLSHSNHYVKS